MSPAGRYLQSVYPVASSREYENTRRIVEQFERGVGRQLHEQLLDRNKHTRNWVRSTRRRAADGLLPCLKRWVRGHTVLPSVDIVRKTLACRTDLFFIWVKKRFLRPYLK